MLPSAWDCDKGLEGLGFGSSKLGSAGQAAGKADVKKRKKGVEGVDEKGFEEGSERDKRDKLGRVAWTHTCTYRHSCPELDCIQVPEPLLHEPSSCKPRHGAVTIRNCRVSTSNPSFTNPHLASLDTLILGPSTP